MTCPVCIGPMVKGKRTPDAPAPERLRCVLCRFQLVLRRLEPRRGRP